VASAGLVGEVRRDRDGGQQHLARRVLGAGATCNDATKGDVT
jgi:hypothetical protein